MKKFVNDPRNFVPEMLQGIALANPDTLKYIPEYNLIMRADAPHDNKVSIIQGSGSGHEPAHVMAVGTGMLDAACPGDVFAAPPMDYVYETTKLLNSPMGVLHIINNYTGDRMAFEMGTELAEADGITVGTLLVNDDVAVKDSTWTVGRRGVAGNFFVIKAVGAASEQGADLEELLRIGNKVNSVTRTMGDNQVTIKYTGTIAGDTITGSMEVPGRDGGDPMKRDWTATRGAASDAAAPAPAPAQ